MDVVDYEGGDPMPRMLLPLAVLVVCLTWLFPHPPSESHPVWQKGWASWYGNTFAGRKTANGERFSPQELTAAHRKLPLGTKVMVKNLQTHELVEVRINDRGPYIEPRRRIIDLSRAAAATIGLLEQGVGPVEVIVTEEAPPRQEADEDRFYEVQVGAFADRQEASSVAETLQGRYPSVYITTRQGPLGRYHRVRIGPFERASQPQRIARALTREGYRIFIDEVPSRLVWIPHEG
jgi:rare lipoprotein A